MPKVSIVIPVYNVEKYLDRCMQSILNQTLKDIEIVLVDDESPDGSPALCDDYAKADSRVKVIHKKNGGLGFARNSGMEIASGEYVTFCDSDDWVELDMYETLYNIASKNELDAVYSEFNPQYYPGFHVILYEEKTYSGSEELERLRLDIVGAEPEYNSAVKFQVSVCKALYKTSIIKENHLEFHSERELISEDLVFNLDFLLHANCVRTTPLQKYYYWLNPDSLTHAYRNNLWQRMRKFYSYLDTRKTEFSDTDEFTIRFQRQILHGVHSCVSQELMRNSDVRNRRSQIETIYNDKYVKAICNNYPFSRLPIRHFLFYYLVAKRQLTLVKLLLFIHEVKTSIH